MLRGDGNAYVNGVDDSDVSAAAEHHEDQPSTAPMRAEGNPLTATHAFAERAIECNHGTHAVQSRTAAHPQQAAAGSVARPVSGANACFHTGEASEVVRLENIPLMSAHVTTARCAAALEVGRRRSLQTTSCVRLARHSCAICLRNSAVRARRDWVKAALVSVVVFAAIIAPIAVFLHRQPVAQPAAWPASIVTGICSTFFLTPGVNPLRTMCLDMSHLPGLFHAVLPDATVLLTDLQCNIHVLPPATSSDRGRRSCISSHCTNSTDQVHSVIVWPSAAWTQNITQGDLRSAVVECPAVHVAIAQPDPGSGTLEVTAWIAAGMFEPAATTASSVAGRLSFTCELTVEQRRCSPSTPFASPLDPADVVPSPLLPLLVPFPSGDGAWLLSDTNITGQCNVGFVYQSEHVSEPMCLGINGNITSWGGAGTRNTLPFVLPTHDGASTLISGVRVAIKEDSVGQWHLASFPQASGFAHVQPFSDHPPGSNAALDPSSSNFYGLVEARSAKGDADVYLRCYGMNNVSEPCDRWPSPSVVPLWIEQNAYVSQVCVALSDWCTEPVAAASASAHAITNCSLVYAFAIIQERSRPAPAAYLAMTVVRASDGTIIQADTRVLQLNRVQDLDACPLLIKHGIGPGQHAIVGLLSNFTMFVLDAINPSAGLRALFDFSDGVPAVPGGKASATNMPFVVSADGTVIIMGLGLHTFDTEGNRVTVALLPPDPAAQPVESKSSLR